MLTENDIERFTSGSILSKKSFNLVVGGGCRFYSLMEQSDCKGLVAGDVCVRIRIVLELLKAPWEIDLKANVSWTVHQKSFYRFNLSLMTNSDCVTTTKYESPNE